MMLFWNIQMPVGGTTLLLMWWDASVATDSWSTPTNCWDIVLILWVVEIIGESLDIGEVGELHHPDRAPKGRQSQLPITVLIASSVEALTPSSKRKIPNFHWRQNSLAHCFKFKREIPRKKRMNSFV